jgi:hypothetical protein
MSAYKESKIANQNVYGSTGDAQHGGTGQQSSMPMSGKQQQPESSGDRVRANAQQQKRSMASSARERAEETVGQQTPLGAQARDRDAQSQQPDRSSSATAYERQQGLSSSPEQAQSVDALHGGQSSIDQRPHQSMQSGQQGAQRWHGAEGTDSVGQMASYTPNNSMYNSRTVDRSTTSSTDAMTGRQISATDRSTTGNNSGNARMSFESAPAYHEPPATLDDMSQSRMQSHEQRDRGNKHQ